jgi:hypothetical protein
MSAFMNMPHGDRSCGSSELGTLAMAVSGARAARARDNVIMLHLDCRMQAAFLQDREIRTPGNPQDAPKGRFRRRISTPISVEWLLKVSKLSVRGDTQFWPLEWL